MYKAQESIVVFLIGGRKVSIADMLGEALQGVTSPKSPVLEPLIRHIVKMYNYRI